MTAYIKLSTNEYPRYAGDIETDQAGIEDYAKVQWIDQPGFNKVTQRCIEGQPVQVDGQWQMTWTIRDATQQELDDAQAYIEKVRSQND